MMSHFIFFKPFDYYYLNPTTRNYVNLIEKLDDVRIVNYYNYNDISVDLENLTIIFLPFALIGISEQQFIESKKRLKAAYYVPNINDVNFGIASEYYNMFLRIYNQSKNSIAILTEYDLHAILEDNLITNFLKRDCDYFQMAGYELYDPEFHISFESDIDIDKAKRGYQYLKDNKNKIISLSHVVELSEFNYSDGIYEMKSRKLSVPGIPYFYRRNFKSKIQKHFRFDYYLSFIDFFLSKLFYQIPFTKFKLFLMKIYFDNVLSKSLFSFTCGSTFGFFIRKFLEIPIKNSCLITYKYKFLGNLGFIENIHYLDVNSISVIDLIESYHRDEKVRLYINSVIENSRLLISTKHSTISHYTYLKKTFEKINEGNFNGSYWENGEYKFFEK